MTGYYITIYDKNGADQCAYYEVDGATVSSVELDNEVLGETVFASDTTYQVGVQAVTRINDTAVFGEQSAKATVKTFSLPAAPKITRLHDGSVPDGNGDLGSAGSDGRRADHGVRAVYERLGV